jgi:GNAT superfamily N-acetyltransferase
VAAVAAAAAGERIKLEDKGDHLKLIGKLQYPIALALFENSRHMMKLTAIAEGEIDAQIWVDGDEPQVAVVKYQTKLLVASRLPAVEIAAAVGELILDLVYTRRMDCNADAALLFWDGRHVREGLQQVLADKYPAYSLRECYCIEPSRSRCVAPPSGYEILPVDAALLERGLENTGVLREEMCSERCSVEAFLRGSFGVCAVKDGALAGWCLSEYNCSEGCEVGIEVVEGHRRQGLAAAMVSAFAREAAQRGVGRIGWLCYKSNAASSATALSAGFEKLVEYGELLCLYHPAVQFAVNGNISLRGGRPEEALGWYDRATALEDAPQWAWLQKAIACTALGRFSAAFDALDAAIARGFNNWGWLRSEPQLEPLRAEDRWKQLF